MAANPDRHSQYVNLKGKTPPIGRQQSPNSRGNTPSAAPAYGLGDLQITGSRTRARSVEEVAFYGVKVAEDRWVNARGLNEIVEIWGYPVQEREGGPIVVHFRYRNVPAGLTYPQPAGPPINADRFDLGACTNGKYWRRDLATPSNRPDSMTPTHRRDIFLSLCRSANPPGAVNRIPPPL